MLSISFFSDSDSIHRNTSIAGDTITSTDSQKPSRAAGASPAGAQAGTCGAVRRSLRQLHFVRSRTCSSSSASASTMTKNTTTTADA